MKKVANIVLNDFTNDSRVLKTSMTLEKLGFECVVLAMHNKGLELIESISGVNVHRVQLRTRPLPKWKPIQLVKYFEFLLKAIWRHRRVDIVHCNDLNALPVGLLIKFFRKNVKVVYDCHEYETEVYGLKGVEKRAKQLLERCLIRYADRIITVSDAIACEYSDLYEIDKPHLILNCPPYKEQKKLDLFRENLGIRQDQTIFLYQGGFTKGRGIELILEAFSGLQSDQNVLVCMGYGHLEPLVKKYSGISENIYHHRAVPPDVLLDYTSSADYGILFYEDTCLNHRYCSPNKMFEYLMAGLPVLSSNLSEMRRLVEDEAIGVVASENTVDGFRRAVINSLMNDYNSIEKNVLEARKKYCWEEQEKVLEKIYGAL
jgi:glycosyltransferase involved in cell wall biosynthesis